MSNVTAHSISVGDRVVYPNQGLCKVTGIETKEVAGQKLSFVTLQREEDGARVMVPEAKVTAIGVRRVATPEDVAIIFGFLKSDSDKASLDWKARARTNVERMAVGGLMGLAEVVKGLQVLSELRPLPNKERGLYNDARHLLVTELSAALSIPACDAEDALDAVLFPPGRDRPRRTAEEFKIAGGDDELGLADDLLGIDGEAALEEEPEEAPQEADAEAAAEGDGDEEDAKPGKKAKKAPAAKAEKVAAGPKRAVISDFEVTEPVATALPALPLPKKRGRPPKPRPAPDAAPPRSPVHVEVTPFAARPVAKPELSKAHATPLAAAKHAPAPKHAPPPKTAPAKAKPVAKAAAKKEKAKPAAKKKK